MSSRHGRGEVQGLLNLAWIALDANQYIVARKANEQALVIARQLGYRFGRILAPPLYSRIPVIDP